MINFNWKKTISLLLGVFALSIGSVALTGCEEGGEEVEIEQGGEELEIEEEGEELEVEED
jgi:hypothetical protein